MSEMQDQHIAQLQDDLDAANRSYLCLREDRNKYEQLYRQATGQLADALLHIKTLETALHRTQLASQQFEQNSEDVCQLAEDNRRLSAALRDLQFLKELHFGENLTAFDQLYQHIKKLEAELRAAPPNPEWYLKTMRNWPQNHGIEVRDGRYWDSVTKQRLDTRGEVLDAVERNTKRSSAAG